MADQYVFNESPATGSQWFAMWRLFETLLLAGHTVAYSSDGTTHGVGDQWTAAGFAGLGSSSYAILTGKGGRQILIQRNGASTTGGDVKYAPGGGWGTAGADAVTPPTAPAGTYTIRSGGDWLGIGGAAPVKLFIRAEDVTTGDGVFWILISTSTAWTSSGMGVLGLFALEQVEAEDAEARAWMCPEGDSGSYSWNPGANLQPIAGQPDNSGGTSGYWRKLRKTGGNFVRYGCAGDAYMGYSSGPRDWAQDPSWKTGPGDLSPHGGGTDVVLHRIHLVKTLESAERDPNGGYVKRCYFATPEDVPNLRTIGGGLYAKFGSWLVLPWTGDDTTPPVEA